MRPVINSEKRIIQITQTNVAGGTVNNDVLVQTDHDQGTGSDPRIVPVGSVVKAIYVELWMLGDGQQPTTITTTIAKFPGGVAQWDSTAMLSLSNTSNKKNIFEMHQGFIGDANTNPVPFYRNWIKIPKGKQRFGLGDRIILSVNTIDPTNGAEYCGVVIYKVQT